MILHPCWEHATIMIGNYLEACTVEAASLPDLAPGKFGVQIAQDTSSEKRNAGRPPSPPDLFMQSEM